MINHQMRPPPMRISSLLLPRKASIAAEHTLFLLSFESRLRHNVWNAAANSVLRRTKQKGERWILTVLPRQSEGESLNFLVLVALPGPVAHPCCILS